MTRLSRLLVATVLALATVAPAGAAELSLTGTSLGLSIGSLPAITVPISGPVVVSSQDGNFALPASQFGPLTITLPRSLFTGVPSISGLSLVGFANGAMSFNGANGTATGGVLGTTLVNVLQLLNLSIPLSPVGMPGATAMTGAGGIQITVQGQGWTTGVASVTGITTTPDTVALNTAVMTGADNRPAGGSLVLVSGFKSITNVAGNLPGFATLTLDFAPEPATFVLFGSAGVAVAVLARRRRR